VYASFAGCWCRQQSAAKLTAAALQAGSGSSSSSRESDARLIEMMESLLVGIGATGMPD